MSKTIDPNDIWRHSTYALTKPETLDEALELARAENQVIRRIIDALRRTVEIETDLRRQINALQDRVSELEKQRSS